MSSKHTFIAAVLFAGGWLAAPAAQAQIYDRPPGGVPGGGYGQQAYPGGGGGGPADPASLLVRID
ncbi:MAG TPA: hypothetical protein VIL72_09645, partial [Beijerinckiaceae bacterium]